MTKIEAIKEILWLNQGRKINHANISRIKKIAKALDVSFDEIAYEALNCSRSYVENFLNKKVVAANQ